MYYWIFLLRRGANLTFFSLFLIYFLLFNFTSPDLELSRFPPRTRHIDQRNAAARRQNSTRGRAHCFFFFFVKKKEIDILLSFLFDRRRMHESVHRLPPFIFFFNEYHSSRCVLHYLVSAAASGKRPAASKKKEKKKSWPSTCWSRLSTPYQHLVSAFQRVTNADIRLSERRAQANIRFLIIP